jgi:hypothetical protein
MQPDCRAGNPRVQFEFPYWRSDPVRSCGVTRHGRRFLLQEPLNIRPTEVTQLNVVLNWFEELKRLTAAVKSQ